MLVALRELQNIRETHRGANRDDEALVGEGFQELENDGRRISFQEAQHQCGQEQRQAYIDAAIDGIDARRNDQSAQK